MKILVIDDQKSVGLSHTSTLKRLGHEPRFVPSASEAWELLEG